jgi:two-component system, OmpR family, response regulator
MQSHVLVVEDDARIGELVRAYLERAGFETTWVRTGESAIAVAQRLPVALVVLDLGLPDMDGFEVYRRLGGRLPLVMLTARGEEVDRVAGLEVGADDYVTKPFSPRELVARVKAVLRRTRTAPRAELLRLGEVELSVPAREVRVAGRPIQLTQREFDLLAYLAERANVVITRDELLEAVWGFLSPGETRTVDVHVASLRRRLGVPDAIRTVRGIGYKAVA